jgi:hypothetical protein
METILKKLIPQNITFNNVEDVPPPNYYEVNQVIEKLKTHKATRLDNIPAGPIKQDGTELKRRIHTLITKIRKKRDSTNRMDRRNNLPYIQKR